jgi:hypothetical protein
MKIWVVLVSLLSVGAFSQKAYSWGDEGHSITALTAQTILTNQSEKGDAQATETLKIISQILGETKMVDAATWPDKVKQLSRKCAQAPYVKDPNYGTGNSKGQSSAICEAYKSTAYWHYINADDDHYAPNPRDPNYFKGDAATLINGLTHVLKNEPAPALNGVISYSNWKSECLKKNDHGCKKEALSFLIHFVGDLHQPLHAGARCDQGANLQYITFFGEEIDPAAFWCDDKSPMGCKKHELHQAWDTTMLVYNPANPTFSLPSYVSKLIPSMEGKTSSSDPKKCVLISAGAPIDVDKSNGPVSWGNESVCYMDQVYNFPDDLSSKLPSIANRCSEDKKIKDDPGHFAAFEVGKNYYQTNITTVNERLYWGGYRLATLLKSIYGSGDKVQAELAP